MAATGTLLSISAVTPDPAIPLPHLVLIDSNGAVVGPVIASATTSFVTVAVAEEGQTFLVEAGRNRLWINGHNTVDYTEPDDTIEQTGLIGRCS